ncbi:MAG TPA: class I SAM-dependent methyltransferase [Pyrinomonadaceae bacterium]|nr:class I SAM-dependent methyltransferase [Pyrinomonadaceae bacterium]
MSQVERKVREHFHADASRFDAIYEERKGPLTRFIDNWWRGVVRKRLEVNLEKLEPLKGKSVLDVGCGSGRFCIAYAERGAARVVGVDFAAAMIEIADRLAAQAGVADRCHFIAGAFPEAVGDETFDASTANGFFDYVEHPVPLIARMRELTRETMIMSFPKAVEWRVPVRRLRFWLKGTPLFLYREGQVKRILAEAGVKDYEWINLDRDYLVVAHL